MNPLGGQIYLLGAPDIANALRTYSPWWAKRNFVVATALVFFLEIMLICLLIAVFYK